MGTQGRTDPVKVTEHILAWLVANNGRTRTDAKTGLRCRHTPPEGVAWFRAFGEGAVEAARASAERWVRREPLSVFDGVPFAAKDNQDTLGYDTYSGTKIMPLQYASAALSGNRAFWAPVHACLCTAIQGTLAPEDIRTRLTDL
jgi:Asp-tRNA(Asn)/Glu-tRNA(Gln) amidotransferase A subunit family amidase